MSVLWMFVYNETALKRVNKFVCFLYRVRLRDDKKTFAICISFQRDTRHYLIDKNQENKFGIQDGPKFDCIMMVSKLSKL